MKSPKVIALVLFFTLFFFSIGTVLADSYASFYWLKDGKAYYLNGWLFKDDEPELATIANYEIKEADIATFKIINFNYAKDKNHVYLYGKILTNRDSQTFQLVTEKAYQYTKDKNHVYYNDEIIDNANPASFVLLDYSTGYSKDDKYVFYERTMLPGADPATIQVLDKQSSSYIVGADYYIKDAKQVYYKGEVIEGADAATFAFILDPRTATTYAKDKKHVFYENQIVIEADPQTFEPIFLQGDGGIAHAEGWFYDAKSIFWQGKKITEIDRKTFRFLENNSFEPGVFLDKDKVFFLTNKIRGADPTTFVLIGKGYTKDAYNVYYEENILPDALPASFKIVGGSHYLWYGKDQQSVFMNEMKIEGADPKTFRLIDNHSYSRDRKHIFYVGKVIAGADPDTFRKSDFQHDGWASGKIYHQDKKHVFFDFTIIPESDVATFEILQPFFAKDKKHVYYEGKVIPLLNPASFRIIDAHYGNFEDDNYKYRGWKLVQE